ncbi:MULTISPECIES: hypothetical protein [unclassified Psychrobacter]|uniref:GapS4a family protein n=1 Tax=unclassified Psychrobacter TaxID=196806 RepID=UPI0007614BE8|nr:hypothetical protein [Psychrobacter sp. P11F6]
MAFRIFYIMNLKHKFNYARIVYINHEIEEIRMAGEQSKEIGEEGERIAKNFLKIIGWGNPNSNEQLACIHSKEHKRPEAKNGRKTHGIDLSYNYISPLESDTLQNIIISVKHTSKPYPNSPQNIFKEHFKDLAQTVECYRHSDVKQEHLGIHKRYRNIRDVGVLLWITSENSDSEVTSKVENVILDKQLSFDTIYLVDNKRMNFIFDVLKFIGSSHSNSDINFYYPDTALNFDNSGERFGKKLPVEYLNSPILPLLLKQGKDQVDIFCLATTANYDSVEFKQLLYIAKEYTNGLNCEFLFLFPDYIESEHSKSINSALRELDVTNTTSVKNFKPDFRSLNT